MKAYEIAKLKGIICSQVSVNKIKILNFRGLVVFLLTVSGADLVQLVFCKRKLCGLLVLK